MTKTTNIDTELYVLIATKIYKNIKKRTVSLPGPGFYNCGIVDGEEDNYFFRNPAYITGG